MTLVLVLFTDASRIDLKLLRREHNLPVRLLTIGLPLTIAVGTLVAAHLLQSISLWEAYHCTFFVLLVLGILLGAGMQSMLTGAGEIPVPA